MHRVIAIVAAVAAAAALSVAPVFAGDSALAATIPVSFATELALNTESDSAADPSSPHLIVAAGEGSLTLESESVDLQALIRNPTDEVLTSGSVTFFVTQHATEGELDTELPIPNRVRIATVAALDTLPETDQVLTASLPIDEFPLHLTEADPGVYEVWVEFRTDSVSAEVTTPLAAFTPLVWRGDEFAENVPLTVVVPILLPPDVEAIPTLSELNAAAGPLLDLLTTAELSAATLAVDPRLIATIRAYGSRASTSAQELLQRLEATFLPHFLLQFADADPAAQAALGFDQLLRPSGLSYITRLGVFDQPEAPPPSDSSDDGSHNNGDDHDANVGTGENAGTDENAGTGEGDAERGVENDAGKGDVAEDGVETSADPPATDHTQGTDADSIDDTDGSDDTEDADGTDDTDAPSDFVPTLDELLAWEHGYAGAWPAAGEVDQHTLTLLFANEITRVLLDSTNASVVGGTRFELPGYFGFEALVADTRLRDQATQIIEASGAIEQDLARAQLGARLALGAQAGSQGTVLALDRLIASNPSGAVELLEWIASHDWVSMVAEEQQPLGTGSFEPGNSAPDRIAQLRASFERSDEVLEKAPLLTEPHLLDEFQQARLLALLGTHFAADSTEFYEKLSREREADELYFRGVEVVRTPNTQLVSVETLLPVQLHNYLPFDASISLRVTPLSASIAVPERVFEPELIVSGGNATVLVPVHSRVSSGNSAILVQVADLAGEQIFFIDSLTLTLRTAFEAILLWSLAGLATLLFGFGIWRSVQRRRRARAHG